MSLPVISVVEECRSNVTLLDSSVSRDGICQNNSALKERNYMGFSDCSSVDSSTISITSEENNNTLTLKATELRLGFLRSESPERDPEFSTKLDVKPLFPLHPSKDNNNNKFLLKTVASGNKRGFSDAMDGFSEGNFHANYEANLMLSPRFSPNLGVKTGNLRGDTLMTQPAKMKEVISQNVVQERSVAATENTPTRASGVDNNNSAPATKTQVVGWPPIRSFRKNTLAASTKNTEEVDGKAGPGALFVKVSMDGAPYLRKVDLRTYSTYLDLSSALEKMFSCFIIGQFGSHGAPGREVVNETKSKDLLNGSEYVVTYEDKDGDWMLVGDVPLEMFIETCKRLKIMKSSDAIGLAPRAMEKCGNKK